MRTQAKRKSNHLYELFPLILSLLAAVSVLMFTVFAFSGNGAVSGNKTTVNIGDTVTVNLQFNATDPSLHQITIGLSEGLQLTGVSVPGGVQNGNSIVVSSETLHVKGSITVKAITAGNKTVTITDLMASVGATVEKTQVSYSCSFKVRTDAEKNESLAAEASRQQSIAAAQAQKASIEASIAASKNAAAQESLSIEESIRESSWAAESKKESIAASIRESESLEELTRPTVLEKAEKDVTFVLYGWNERLPEGSSVIEYENRFYFASDDSALEKPEEFKQAKLLIRDMAVLALKRDGMDKDTFLVYGTSDPAKEPKWYYYNSKTNEFFAFEYLNSDAVFVEDETTEEVSTTEAVTEIEVTEPERNHGNGLGNGDFFIFLGLAAFLGLLVGIFAVLLFTGAKKDKKAKEKREAVREQRLSKTTVNQAAPKAAPVRKEEPSYDYNEIDLSEADDIHVREVEADDER